MSESILIQSAAIEGGERADILIEGGVIAEVGRGLARDGARVIDASGLIALPGLVDLHVHLREPGYEASETVLTGTRAAAAGGFTAVFAMPNTLPVADNAQVVERELELGEAAGYATVQPIGAVTIGQQGLALSDLEGMAESAAAVRVFSDDGFCVSDPLLMRQALERVAALGGVIAQHAQDPRLTEGAQMNEGVVSAELGLPGWPAVAEESIIARDVLRAEHLGARLHVCHLSTAGSVDIVRWAKQRGIQVTAEVTPHHLLLTDELVRTGDPRYKVNPPLRRDEDVLAVRRGLADGTIDIVATDHAPHPAEAKSGDWSSAANGMVGLESALRVVHQTMVETGLLTWVDVARVMSKAPARIGQLPAHGTEIAAGQPAEIVLYDPAVGAEFTVSDLRGRSTNTPYGGRLLPGSVRWTIHRGYVTLADGELAELENHA
jgi:dihydroorotase